MTPAQLAKQVKKQHGYTEPEYHVRGTLDVWLRVEEDGTVTGLDFNRDSFEIAPPGASFVRSDAEEMNGDGPDLTLRQLEALQDHITRSPATWSLSRIEDGNGAVWMDA